jgi:fumarate reductase subunit C
MSEARLYLLQRLSAMLLAPLVMAHLALIVAAVRGGLSAAEILSRTEGSLVWALFYGLFVLAVVVHAPIGLRSVLREWTSWRGRSLDWAMAAFAALLFVLGLRAVSAVVL